MKLKRPVNVLRRAVDNININNLEFEVDYYNQDELGTLCTAVEKMRYELFKSKSQVSKLIQEKRVLTVSIDHDVSAPITEIKGYIGYLQKNIHNMKIFKDDISETLYKMDKLALRLGNYVDCVKEVQIYEKIQVENKVILISTFLKELESNLNQVFVKSSLKFIITNNCSMSHLSMDKQMIMLIIKNVVMNSFRYAKNK